MFDIFDFMAFAVFAVLLAVGVILIVGIGSLPGWVARKRGHPQAAAVNAAGWLGLATLGLLWPFALVWAFLNSPPSPDAKLAPLQSQVNSLEAALRELRAKEEVVS